jgi:biotin carboxylase
VFLRKNSKNIRTCPLKRSLPQVRSCDLRAIKQIFAGSANEALEWQRVGNLSKWPVIVKPNQGAGTQGVHWCNSEEDVEAGTLSLQNDLITLRFDYTITRIRLDYIISWETLNQINSDHETRQQ